MLKEAVLIIKDLSFRYDLRTNDYQLNQISLDFNRGEWVTVIGDNGSGKSTLARVMIGLYPVERGTIQLDGVHLSEETVPLFRRRIGMVFQNPDNQFIGTSVEDDVAFSLENQNLTRSDMKRRVKEALQEVGMWQERKLDPQQLSGGQKQRVQIAGLLALQPEIMIFDEAFVMIDPAARRDLLELLHRLKEKHHLTIISISHEREALVYSDRIIQLKQGTVFRDGSLTEIFAADESLEPPMVERLNRALTARGRGISESYLTEEALVNFLCKSN